MKAFGVTPGASCSSSHGMMAVKPQRSVEQRRTSVPGPRCFYPNASQDTHTACPEMRTFFEVEEHCDPIV